MCKHGDFFTQQAPFPEGPVAKPHNVGEYVSLDAVARGNGLAPLVCLPGCGVTFSR